MSDKSKLKSELMSHKALERYQLFQIDTIPIRYHRFLVVSIPNFDTDTIKFEPSNTVFLKHIIVAKMVLDNCGKFFLEHN